MNFTDADRAACEPYEPESLLLAIASASGGGGGGRPDFSSLTESDRREALAAAAAAKRAEERAEQRAERRSLERAEEERLIRRRQEDDEKRAGGKRERNGGGKGGVVAASAAAAGGGAAASDDAGGGKLVFLSKKRRAELALDREKGVGSSAVALPRVGEGGRNGVGGVGAGAGPPSRAGDRGRVDRRGTPSNRTAADTRRPELTNAELLSIKRAYLGKSALEGEAESKRKELERQRRQRRQKKMTFKFEWDASEDTARDEIGVGGTPQHRLGGSGSGRHGHRGASAGRPPPSHSGALAPSRLSRAGHDPLHRDVAVARVASVSAKPIDRMTNRDWRIFRENFNIVVRGGKAPPPLRTFRETPQGIPPIHPVLIDAIENVLRYREPSAIQRQAIPIGMQRRDLIGIAETGSGKTAAFGIPLCHHILSLPNSVHETVAEDGPLALVMAPTRELALQIDAEFLKMLSRQRKISTLAVVGGQPIQVQAGKLRDGVHVVVGTPGRLNDCLEMAYLVLNQCSYVVLDEADRMIDLGFAPQIEQILESMGGLLKSEDETEAYKQEREDLERLGQVVPRHRLTAMFSATMPAEVERIAKRYLRHPAVVSIGDEDSGKNARIEQRIVFLKSPGMKEGALRRVLGQTRPDQKIIVFVNEKKHADGVGRMVERIGRRCVVLHGGKTQDQREENLAAFRHGGMVLVATDVAGRGLDIPDVSHIVNYDLPSRSIDNYCHRIGRTGRAGKEGIATSFLTDEDEGIMAPLKQYLESTGSPVPDKLAKHPAASAGVMGGNIR